MKIRKLKDGQVVTVHHNDGIRKRCGCARRSWATCSHPWHFSFKPKGSTAHHRFPLDRYAEHPILSRDEALAERDRLRILIRSGQFPPVTPATLAPTTPADLTFATFAEKWLANARSQQSDNQKLNDKGIVRRFSKIELQPGQRLGQRPLGLFTVDDWETVFGTLGTLAASTVNKYRQTILAMQDWACDKGYLPKPWLAGKVIRKNGPLARRKGARRDRRLAPDVLTDKGQMKQAGEERRLVQKASPWLQRLIIAALDTGCRRGELMSLQWQDVSLSRGQITVRAETTKTDTMRQVPISPRLLAVLKLIEHDPAGNPHKPTAYVFGDKIGQKVCDPKKVWLKCCAEAGITGLHFHDLRHEAGSRFLEAGWALHHVQKMLGHQDAKTTSIYLNATVNELTDSMRRFGSGGQTLHDLAQSQEQEPPPSGQQIAAPVSNSMVN